MPLRSAVEPSEEAQLLQFGFHGHAPTKALCCLECNKIWPVALTPASFRKGVIGSLDRSNR
ncbi:MAG: hypothetical protein AAFO17_17815, partial [Pseudomonadota bacterium]